MLLPALGHCEVYFGGKPNEADESRWLLNDPACGELKYGRLALCDRGARVRVVVLVGRPLGMLALRTDATCTGMGPAEAPRTFPICTGTMPGCGEEPTKGICVTLDCLGN